MTDSGAELLAQAIILSACQDILKRPESDINFKSAKRFLLSERFHLFTQLDGQWLFEQLMKQKQENYYKLTK